MPIVGMDKTHLDFRVQIVGQAKSEQRHVEMLHLRQQGRTEHDMTEPQRTGTEAANRTARLEFAFVGAATGKKLDAIPIRIERP